MIGRIGFLVLIYFFGRSLVELLDAIDISERFLWHFRSYRRMRMRRALVSLVLFDRRPLSDRRVR